MKFEKQGVRVAARQLILALAVGAGGFAGSAAAQSNVDGSIYGSVQSGTNAQIVVEGVGSGTSVTVSPAENGRFRIPALPVGSYKVTLKREGVDDVVRMVDVSIGSATQVSFAESDSVELGTYMVSGSALAPIDTVSTEVSLNISSRALEKLPVPRSLNSVALLAPGTVRGDTAFGNNVSFGGASVAENTYYFNGFNITNFRDGLGFNNVPYEFFDTFQVKTGGYGAEFGRSLGGVVNATSKRGGDQFEAGGNVYWEPDFTRSKSPTVMYDSDGDGEDDTYLVDNRSDKLDEVQANIYASGPIIPGHLYAYGLVNFRSTKQKYATVGTLTDYKEEDPFYGVKVDYLINSRHSIDLTYWHNKTTGDYDHNGYDNDTRVNSGYLDTLKEEQGGDTFIARYTGRLTDSFTISALAGRSKLDSDNLIEPADCTFARNYETGEYYGCARSVLVDTNRDQRDAYRVDLEYYWNTHVIRGGMDYEKLQVGNNDYYSGPTGYYYRYYPSRNSANGSYALEARRYENVGTFKTYTSAVYLEDTWSVTDRFSIYAGIRNEMFENKDVNGETFFKVDDQWAPRLGISYDILGGGRSKLYANWGRYYLPIATNTNIRVGGAELYEYVRYDSYESIDDDGLPVGLGDELASGYFNGSNGEAKDTRQLVDQEGIKPMYQDEYSVGFQMNVADHWNAGIRFIRRELKRSLEDECFDGMIADATCALVNPGTDVTLYTHYQDTNGDGLYFEDPTDDLHAVTLLNSDLGFPKAERKYNAVELSVERVFDQKWTFQGNYTWSQSYGNTEGYLNSDNGQTDPGITIAFDYPGLTEYNSGYLPNDRRHKIKLFGAYQMTDEFQIGLNAQAYSGRPINCFGNYPDPSIEDSGDYSGYYGAATFYCGGEPSPRGSHGTTPWQYQLDLALRYTPAAVDGLTAGVDVFNLLNGDAKTQVDEYGEYDGFYYEEGLENPSYKKGTAFQTPRYVRFSLSYKFH